MKSVLRLMALSYAGPGKPALLGIWGFVLVTTLALQALLLTDQPPEARRGLFGAQLIMLCAVMFPWSLANARAASSTIWWLLPWGNLRLALAQGLNCTVFALLVALCHAIASNRVETLLAATFTAFPSTYVVLSLFGLHSLIWTRRMARHLLLASLLTVGFAAALAYSLSRSLPLVTDPRLGSWVWLAFGGAVIAWLLGGWLFARRPAAPRGHEWKMHELFEGFRAQYLMDLGPVAALIRARSRPTFRNFMLGFWILFSFAPMLMQPAIVGDGFIVATAYFSAMSGWLAFVMAQDTVRSSRALWLVSGDRQVIFRACEKVLIRNNLSIACLAGLALLLGAWLLDRLTPGLGTVMGLSLCVFLPLSFSYLGLRHLALPPEAQWRFGSVWLILIAITLCSLLVVPGLINAERDQTMLLSSVAAAIAVLVIVVRKMALHAWKRVDWTFLPRARK